MQIVYAREPSPASYTKSIFLAGPTPRSDAVPGWRKQALSLLDALGYDGVVFVPEPRDGIWLKDYQGQLEWEQTMRRKTDVQIFWVPRDVRGGMPALTTNVEFGEDYASGRIVYGRPDEADNCRYLDALYRQVTKRDPANDLMETLQQGLVMLGDGNYRADGETDIPLQIWRHTAFQSWLNAQKAAGNRLLGGRVMSTFPHGSPRPFFFQIHARVWIESEQRAKVNEFILGRPDISSVAMLHGDLAGDPLDLTAVLVEEFRSPVRNKSCMTLECAGGSSLKPGQDARLVALEEIHEETGFDIADPNRLIPVGSSQIAATWSIHHAMAYALHLTDDELAAALDCAKSRKTFGNIEDSEITRLRVMKVRETLSEGMDWANFGMLLASAETLKSHR